MFNLPATSLPKCCSCTLLTILSPPSFSTVPSPRPDNSSSFHDGVGQGRGPVLPVGPGDPVAMANHSKRQTAFDWWEFIFLMTCFSWLHLQVVLQKMCNQDWNEELCLTSTEVPSSCSCQDAVFPTRIQAATGDKWQLMWFLLKLYM